LKEKILPVENNTLGIFRCCILPTIKFTACTAVAFHYRFHLQAMQHVGTLHTQPDLQVFSQVSLTQKSLKHQWEFCQSKGK